MSIDIRLDDVHKKCEHCGREEETCRVHEWDGCTYNLNPIVELAFQIAALRLPANLPRQNEATAWWRLKDAKVSDVLTLMEEFGRVIADPTFEVALKSFDPPNGWGSLEDMRPLVAKLVEACKQYPNAVFNLRG